jgi:hypothetical protein
MEQLLAEGPTEIIFGLMMAPLAAGILLLAFLIISATRRGKKSKMKSGTQPSTQISDKNLPLKTNPPDPTLASQPLEPTAEELNLHILNQPPEDLPQTGPIAQSVAPVEMMRLLREPQTGQLIVEVAGQRYTKLAEIKDKGVGQYVLKIAAHLLAFTNGVIVTDIGMKSVYTPNKRLSQLPLPLTGATPIPATPSPSPQPASLKKAPPPSLRSISPLRTPPPAPAKRGLFGIGANKPATPVEAAPPLNLAGEIDEIVQRRLGDSPLAETTRIVITSDPEGGLVIWVNDQTYHSSDDITDSTVRNLIKDAIKEWERR